MLPVGGTQIGANELEREGVESGGSDGTGEGGQLAAGRSGGVAGVELSAGEAGVGAVSRGRGQGVAAPELRAAIESRLSGGVSSDAGERAPGQRGRAEDCCREFAALAARSRDLAPAAEAETLSPAEGPQAACWRTGATGRQLSSLAGESRGRRLFNAHGGRCYGPGARSVLCGRDDLGGGATAAALDRTLRSAARALHRLEERVRAQGDGGRATRRDCAGDPVRAHVPEAGHWHHRRQFATGQRAGGAVSWHASGPAGEEAAAARDCELRRCQPLSGGTLHCRAQPALRPAGGGRSRLSPATSDGAATGRSLLAGGGTGGERRLGGALQKSSAATRAAEETLGAGAESSGGAGERSRRDCHSLSREAFVLQRNSGFAREERRKGRCPFLRASIPEPYPMARLYATQHTPVETRLSAHENPAAFGGLVTHYAGDISIVENAGTFLLWYDRRISPLDRRLRRVQTPLQIKR